MAYGIKQKISGDYFGGFNEDYSVIWTSKDKAKAMTFREAKTQAALFLSSACDQQVQRKPVEV